MENTKQRLSKEVVDGYDQDLVYQCSKHSNVKYLKLTRKDKKFSNDRFGIKGEVVVENIPLYPECLDMEKERKIFKRILLQKEVKKMNPSDILLCS